MCESSSKEGLCWGCLRIGCWEDIVDLTWRKWKEGRENYIVRSRIICNFYRRASVLLFDLISQLIHACFSVNFSCNALKRFQCENHRCVPRYQLCDGIDNCGDGSDENNMTLCASRLKPCNLYAEYQCANKKCIDRSRVCDFGDDCGDSSDELGCRKCLLLPRSWMLNFTVAWIAHNLNLTLLLGFIVCIWSVTSTFLFKSHFVLHISVYIVVTIFMVREFEAICCLIYLIIPLQDLCVRPHFLCTTFTQQLVTEICIEMLEELQHTEWQNTIIQGCTLTL